MLYKSLFPDTALKNKISLLPLFLLFLFVLLFPEKSLQASKSGILLWFDTLLPTLLPFLILSQLILKTELIEMIKKWCAPFFQKLFHCSENGAFCILCGFLCGYPVGARLIALQIREKKLSVSEGQYLLSFCSNLSPMFCISFGIREGIGTDRIFPYLLFIYGSALLFGLFSRPAKAPEFPVITQKKQTSFSDPVFQIIDVCIIDSFLIMIKLCGYLILFSLLNSILAAALPKDNPVLFSAVAAFSEISSGLSLLHNLQKGWFRSALAVAAMTFGGVCCIFQTNSVLSGSGLSLKKYVLDKILTTMLALFLFLLWYLL